MKFLIASALILGLLYTVVAQSHNIKWGSTHPGDRLLYREIAVKKYSFAQKVTKDVEYNGLAIISCINATDQYTNGDGGYATLLKGGVNSNEVKVHLKSKRNHGLNFIIEIYGR